MSTEGKERSRRLFGTDGIRGRAWEFPLDADTAVRVGRALVQTVATSPEPRILIGRDTRESGPALERHLGHGIRAAGGHPISGGVLPTPAVAHLTRHGEFDAGLVISASHNPFTDNGVKIFSSDGFKLSDDEERSIERLVAQATDRAVSEPPPVDGDASLAKRYREALRRLLPDDFTLAGRRLAIDCANGAASGFACELFEALGAQVLAIACSPDGRNINLECGSQHPEAVVAAIRSGDADLGVAYDGDADRCVFVDERGQTRDGDDLLAIAAGAMSANGSLGPGGVVGTVMANYGFAQHLASLAIPFTRTDVGDRHVLAEMRRRGARVGGEQSGHIIFLDHATTGDGILTSLMMIRFIIDRGEPLSKLASVWTRLPQILHNVRVRERRDLDTVPALREQISRVERELGDRGRVLIRYSGTEPLVRIMLEGPDQDEIEQLCAALAQTLGDALGTSS